MNDLLTTEQAAKSLQVHGETIRQWIREGRIEFIKLAEKDYRISQAALDRYVMSRVRHYAEGRIEGGEPEVAKPVVAQPVKAAPKLAARAYTQEEEELFGNLDVRDGLPPVPAFTPPDEPFDVHDDPKERYVQTMEGFTDKYTGRAVPFSQWQELGLS